MYNIIYTMTATTTTDTATATAIATTTTNTAAATIFRCYCREPDAQFFSLPFWK